MRTLNDIPDYLREPERKEWTPGRGLLQGTICTLIAAAVLGALLGAVTYYAPRLTFHWLLNVASGFLITWILFVVMYRAGGMVSKTGALIVILGACLILVVKYLALLMHFLNAEPGTGTLWSSFDVAEMAVVSYPAWIGVLVAAFMCKDGEQLCAGGGVPNPDDAVFSARSDLPSIGAEEGTVHPTFVAPDGQ